MFCIIIIIIHPLYFFKPPEHAVQCSRLDLQYLNLRKKPHQRPNILCNDWWFYFIDDIIYYYVVKCIKTNTSKWWNYINFALVVFSLTADIHEQKERGNCFGTFLVTLTLYWTLHICMSLSISTKINQRKFWFIYWKICA